MPSNLNHIYQLVCNEILDYSPNKKERSRNLTNSSYKILADLANNESTVIKKADKGSNTVIMNKTDCINEAKRQLNDTKFYRKQSSDLTLPF